MAIRAIRFQSSDSYLTAVFGVAGSQLPRSALCPDRKPPLHSDPTKTRV